MLGKIEGKRWPRMRWLDGINGWMDMSLSKLWQKLKDREACYAIVHGVTLSWTWLCNWTAMSFFNFYLVLCLKYSYKQWTNLKILLLSCHSPELCIQCARLALITVLHPNKFLPWHSIVQHYFYIKCTFSTFSCSFTQWHLMYYSASTIPWKATLSLLFSIVSSFYKVRPHMG